KQFDAASRPAPKALVKKLAGLRKDLAAANKAARTSRDFKAAEKAHRLAAQINKLQAQIDRYELRVANALWAEKTYPFKQSYLDTIRKYHGSALFGVDFVNASQAVRKRINAWVEKQTRERIKDLVPSGALNRDTRLVVTNAIYFKGQWTEPFET